MRIPVTNFGNVTHGDAVQLISILGTGCGRLARTRAPVRRQRRAGVARRRLGLGPGRRRRRRSCSRSDAGCRSRSSGSGSSSTGAPSARGCRVGTITDHTTATFLEQLVAVLDDFKGSLWTLDTLTIMRRVPIDDNGEVEEIVLEEIPLGPLSRHTSEPGAKLRVRASVRGRPQAGVTPRRDQPVVGPQHLHERVHRHRAVHQVSPGRTGRARGLAGGRAGRCARCPR